MARDIWRYGALSGGIGSFDQIQWTDNTSGSTQYTILDSSRNLGNVNNADIGGTLTADGLASMNAGLSASSVAVADLTNGSIVLAGASGELEDNSSLTFDGSDLTVNGSTFGASVVISGDLTVQGTTTTVQSTEVTIADKALVVASGSTDAQVQAAGGAGIKSQGESGASFLYDGSDSWDASENMNLASGKSFNISDTDMLNISGAAKVRSGVAGDGLGHSAGVLSVNVDDSSIETNSDTLRIKALGVTNAMLSGGIASSKISELNIFDTADLTEGTNLYYTDARARAALSGTDNGGDGSFSYNQSTGEISYTGPSASETRAHFSSGYMIDYSGGEFSIDSSEFSASWDAAMAADNTDSLSEGATNQYYLDSRARAAVDASNASNSGRGSLSYDSGSGVFSYEGVTQAEIRSDISVTDVSGDGSLSYDSGSGVITYTGPSASEVRAHFSGAAGIALSSGDISVNVDDAGIEISGDTLRLKSTAMAGTTNEVEVAYSNGQFTVGLPDNVTVTGNATISGSLAFDAGTSVDRILDEDGMASDSPSALATQQSIKAYVDAQLTAQDLDMQSDSGSGSVDLDSQTLTIAGTANEIETSFSGQTLTVGLPSSVTITTNLTVGSNADVGGTLNADGNVTLNADVGLGDSTADSISMNGRIDTALLPNGLQDIGSDTYRWGDIYATNMYTGDLHMKNERGDWTLFEESDHIRIRNNATGQEFKLNMTPVE